MKNSKIVECHSIVARGEDLLVSEVDGDVVMMSVEQGVYSGLNTIGSAIWRLLEHPKCVSDLCDRLMERYDVDRHRCEQDVIGFLNDLVSNDTIRIVSDATV